MTTPESAFLRVMGLDVGERRTGVAVSDELGLFATPLRSVERNHDDMQLFASIAAQYAVGQIVAGLPRGLSGREGAQAADARSYATEVAMALQLPLLFWDERMTTLMAQRSLTDRGVKRNQRKEQVDAVAAAFMLQGWLDSASSKRDRR